ncbi:MAG: hypothetical protein UY98_C0015G0001, partial [Candidatus Kaiserbacteria bacterium GW2011_GWA2_58_9]
MIKVLERAIKKVKKLSKQRQEYAAEVLENIAEAGDEIYKLTDDERRLVREGLSDLDAGRVVSDEEMAAFCKRKGFVYPTAEIYGGLAGFWDFGPLGVELKNNIKRQWWKHFVQSRNDIFGIDGSIITNRKVWEASGHAACFADLMLTSKKTKI